MKNKFLVKLVVIGALMLGLMVPLAMIEGVVSERSAYRNQAKSSIAASWTGEQKFLGPLLVVPYSEKQSRKVWDKNLEDYRQEVYYLDRRLLILPEALEIDADVATEERSRGIYAIPVYNSALAVRGAFNNRKVLELLKQDNISIAWNEAFVSLIVSDIRGIVMQPLLNWDDKALEFVSGSGLDQHGNGMRANVTGLKNTEPVSHVFSFDVHLHGMESLQFSPVGKSTRVNVRSDWLHPSFIGRYLPGERNIDPQGFNASWQVSSFSSDMERVAEMCQQGSCDDYVDNTFGVSLLQSVDIYQQAERSVKYAILFVSLTFVAFFLFEVMKSLRLHPMQYLLVGCALSVFYLLLVSLSEHIDFSRAYLVASLANAGLIGLYISAVLEGRLRAAVFTGLLLLLYSMLYVILCSEDNALLMGSLLIFAILALLMVITRKLDWYRVAEQLASQAATIGGRPGDDRVAAATAD
ncbi:MAG: cell envelope integrity protein CreD [Gammaproteobacteria bacterium]